MTQNIKSLLDFRFDCELTTFLISKGASEDICNDFLREPSIRGSLRWWFRVLTSTFMRDTEWKRLERLIFGSTKNKGILKIKVIRESINIISWNRINIQQNQNSFYLFYTMRKGRKDREWKKVFESSQFSIIFIFDKELFNNLIQKEKSEFHNININLENVIQILILSFWGLLYLGGLGSRNRRGAGKINLNNPSNEFFNKNIYNYKPSEFIGNYLRNCLENILHRFENMGYTLQINTNNEFDQYNIPKIYPPPMNMWIHKEGFQELLESLNLIGEKYKNFRKNKLTLTQRLHLGLPVIGKRYQYYHKHAGSNIHNKRASPLFIGVIKWNKRYHPYFTFFFSQYIPDNSDIIRYDKRNRQTRNRNVSRNDFQNVVRIFNDLFENENLWERVF
jgi:CRISPR-associated protein Cmr1